MPNFLHISEESNAEENSSILSRVLVRLGQWRERHRAAIIRIFTVVFILLYAAFFSYAMYFDFRRNVALLVLTSFALLCFVTSSINGKYGERIEEWYYEKFGSFVDEHGYKARM